MKNKKEKILIVFTVIPNDFEFSTQHFENENDAIAWAKTYVSGASVIKNELPERVVKRKNMVSAKHGYKFR